jgi:hypothetical protein
MLGIGLGGFMDGFEKGEKIRAQVDDRQRKQMLQERQDVEYNRAVDQRTQIEAIGKDAQTEFNSRVEAGTMAPEQFEQFWSGYTIPKLRQQYLLNGDIDGADKVQKWGESAEAREGGKLFTSALLKSQTGDAAGALSDAMKLGQMKGYMSHGMEVLGQETINGGFRLRIKGPDGKEVNQDILSEDVPRLIATFGNPQSAWESHLATQAAKAKADAEVDTHRRKKEIDRDLGLNAGPTKENGDILKSLRKIHDGGLDGSGVKFDDMPPEQQQKLMQEEHAKRRGVFGLPNDAGASGGGTGRQVVVDTVSGRAVDPAEGRAAAPERKPQADSASPSETERPAPSWLDRVLPPVEGGIIPGKATEARQKRREEQSRAQQSQADGRSTGQRATDTMVRQAADMLGNGVAPEAVKQSLLDAGIPIEDWPDNLRALLAEAEQRSIGIR